MKTSTILLNGSRVTVDAATAGTVRFAMRRFAAMTVADRQYVVGAATSYFAAVAAGEASDRFLGQFEGRMGFRCRDEVQIQWVMEVLLEWWEDGYSWYSDGTQRR